VGAELELDMTDVAGLDWQDPREVGTGFDSDLTMDGVELEMSVGIIWQGLRWLFSWNLEWPLNSLVFLWLIVSS
jgi:hypothetical protein